MYAFLKGIMRLIVNVYLAGLFRTEGAERVPRTGGLLVCPNHIGTIDPPLVPAFLPRPDSWSMAKAEWFQSRFTRVLFTWYHAFPVVRHTPDRRALNRALGILKDGHALIVYPEGHRAREGGLQEAEPGAGFLARVSGAPVLPVGLIGTRECLPRGAWWPRRVSVEVRFGPRLTIRPTRPDGARVTAQEATDAIMLAVAELLPPELRGHYSDIPTLRERLSGTWEPAVDNAPTIA